jgi:hypothetical protein
MKSKRRPERIALRVVKGGFQPADDLSASRLRLKGYAVNDLVFAEIKKPRSPGFHRLAHRLGSLIAENVEAFSGMDAHSVLKRLQWEAGIGCEEIGVNVPGVGMAMMRWPLSLSFESMEEGEFREVISGLCRHVSEKYWPSVSPEQVERMAENWVEAA